jgi:deoxyribodipyrimidine photo-lyase
VAYGVPDPAPGVRAGSVEWLRDKTSRQLEDPDEDLLPLVGEKAARKAWRTWLSRDSEGVRDYAKLHDFPGLDATSHLSIALRWGHLHPRTVLYDLREHRSRGAAALARQIAWRDFFADVLLHRPDAVSQPIRGEFTKMPTEEPDRTEITAKRLQAWKDGTTGYPLVDAGMRQLQAEGWMHNRVRMVVASFLIKDLHIGWWHGADWFMEHLRDGDIAQNQLNWQWVAGCGTDAAPYFRIFNPTGQAEKFDPDGSYIRRYVSELADLPLEHLHQPWAAPSGVPRGYPEPIIDHAVERQEALDRYAVVKGS